MVQAPEEWLWPRRLGGAFWVYPEAQIQPGFAGWIIKPAEALPRRREDGFGICRNRAGRSRHKIMFGQRGLCALAKKISHAHGVCSPPPLWGAVLISHVAPASSRHSAAKMAALRLVPPRWRRYVQIRTAPSAAP